MKNVVEVIEKEIQRLEAELSEFKRALAVLTEKPSDSLGKARTKYKFYIDGLLCDKEAFEYLNQFTENSDVTMELLKRLTVSNVVDEYISEHKKQAQLANFGQYGMMTRLTNDINNSGITWSSTKQGQNFWKDVLGYESV